MKIALIIFPIHPSHGCILQTFALQQVLLYAGHEVTIIDRQREKPNLTSIIKDIVKVTIKRACGESAYLQSTIKRELMTELNIFVGTKLKNRIVYYNNPKYEDLPNFDAFVVGSDQTWRPKYVSDVLHYYLCFIPKDVNVKRIAYAPSFGTEDWEYTPELTATCRELLQRFDAVSIREQKGVEMCKDNFGVDAEHVLDPTMLLTKEDYLEATDNEYVLDNVASYYFLDKTPHKMEIVKNICDSLHLKPQRINTETENSKAPIKERIAPSIEKWIGGFAHSSFIIADSFHATVFAILFNKPFVTIANETRGLARFQSLLKMVGLEDRMITTSSQSIQAILDCEIDWDAVNKIIEHKRKESKRFLFSKISMTTTDHRGG